METKLVAKKFIHPQDEEDCSYVQSSLVDWSDSVGPGIDGSINLYDGKNTCHFWFCGSSDEEYEKGVSMLRDLASIIEVTEREFTMAYLDAKIRSANAESETKNEEREPTPEED